MTKLNQPIINHNQQKNQSILTFNQFEFAQATMKTQDKRNEGMQNSNSFVNAINNVNANTKCMKTIKQFSKNINFNINFNPMQSNCMQMQKEDKFPTGTEIAKTSKNKKFSFDEDLILKKAVYEFGAKNWKFIAAFLPGRTPRQCRDRYSNYLIPGFLRVEWTDYEDNLLAEKFCLHGPKWTYIKQFFPYRTANDIKNRFNYTVSRKSNLFKPLSEQISIEKVDGSEDENLEFFELNQDQFYLFNDNFQINDFDYLNE